MWQGIAGWTYVLALTFPLTGDYFLITRWNLSESPKDLQEKLSVFVLPNSEPRSRGTNEIKEDMKVTWKNSDHDWWII